MCGIVGIAGYLPVAERLVSGLERLEYRGYDSSGIATIYNNSIERRRAEGKLIHLKKLLEKNPISGFTGIGHTRWATHGMPTESNAHPHATDKVAVVHNGIIENFRELKAGLEKKGVKFTSQTDTEVIVHLIDQQLRQGKAPKDAVAEVLPQLEGAFALGIIFAEFPDQLIAARQGSPLAVGYGDNEMYLGSDAIALSPFTNRIAYLEDGDWAVLTKESVQFYDVGNQTVTRPIKISQWSGAAVGKGEFAHFMHKEIHEQPSVVGEAMGVFCDYATQTIQLPKLPFNLSKLESITLVACGTSYYSAAVARYWFETYAKLPVQIDIASEYRYRPVLKCANTLTIFISQSGETADTLAAMRITKQAGIPCLAIVNMPESTMAHEADGVLQTYAGVEIGVASTKAFTTQLVTLACFMLACADAKQTLTPEIRSQLMLSLAEVPARMVEVLHNEDRIAAIAKGLVDVPSALYIGRGSSHAIALEGALKLKEISYIHADGYPAGELKHGPIALVSEEMPVIVIAPSDALFDKTVSNMQEVAARGGKLILCADAQGIEKTRDILHAAIEMPTVHPFAAPILYALPIQLLAYHVAVLKGTDVDQPRNLAKSVTVE